MPNNIVRLPIPAPAKEKKKTKKAKGLMPDGRYRAWADLGTHPNGKRNRLPFYSRVSFAEAKAEADKYAAAHKAGQNLTAAGQTVGDWAAKWLIAYGSGAGDSANYSNDLYVRLISASDLGKMPLKDVRDYHVQTFANSISDQSKAAVDKIRSVVRRVFAKAVANRLIVFNPTDEIQWKDAGAGTHRALEDDEISAIVSHWQHHRTGLWAMLMLWTGMRRGELLALRWSDIDFDAGIVRITKGVHFKRNKQKLGPPKSKAGFRDVPIQPPLYEALAGLYGPPRSAHVCLGAKGAPATKSIFESSWPTLLTMLTNAINGSAQPFRHGMKPDAKNPPQKVINFRPHDLRHTFCTMLFDAGVDLKTAQYLMGHDDVETTMQIYTHLSKTRKAQSLDGLKEWCSKWCSGSKQTQ